MMIARIHKSIGFEVANLSANFHRLSCVLQ